MKNIFLLLILSPYLLVAQSLTEKKELSTSIEMGVSFELHGKIYVATGHKVTTSAGSRTTWEYDPISDLWTQKENLPSQDVRTGAVGFAINNIGYVGGGSTSYYGGTFLTDFWAYDPIQDEWTQKDGFSDGIGRTDASSFVINGKGYVVFGARAKQFITNFTPINSIMRYDPVTDDWTTLNTVQLGSIQGISGTEGLMQSGTFVINNEAYFVGGMAKVNGNYGFTSAVLKYNVGNNTWTTVQGFPTPKAGIEAFTLNGDGYAFGGYGVIVNGQTTNGRNPYEYYKYNPSSSTWTTLGVYPGNDDGNKFLFGAVSCLNETYVGGKSFYRFIDNPNIQGSSNIVCTTNQTFTINVPSGVPVSWSVSPTNLFGNDSGTGTSFTTYASSSSSSGSGTITATIDNDCGPPLNIEKNVYVGNYLPKGTSNYISNCSAYNFNVLKTNLSAACTPNTSIYFGFRVTDPNYSNLVFTPVSVPSGASWSYNGGNLSITITTPPSQGTRTATIALNATGPCGNYNVNFTATAVNYYSGGYYYSSFPNPASETLTIEQTYNIEGNSEFGTFMKRDSSDTHYFSLYNFNNNKIVLEGPLSGKTEIDVSKLEKGRYILKIRLPNDKEETHQVIID